MNKGAVAVHSEGGDGIAKDNVGIELHYKTVQF